MCWAGIGWKSWNYHRRPDSRKQTKRPHAACARGRFACRTQHHPDLFQVLPQADESHDSAANHDDPATVAVKH